MRITARIAELDDWRGEVLAAVRAVIHAADPDVLEEWKWERPSSSGVAVWSHDGGLCTGEVYNSVVKLTFFKGASLPDPKGLFNASLEGNVRRAIDIAEGARIDVSGLTMLIKAAVKENVATLAARAAKKQAAKKQAAKKQK